MDKIPIQAIIRSFEGKLQGKERQELDKWLLAAEKNRQHYEELRKTYNTSENFKIGFKLDEANALKNVNRKISSKRTIRIMGRAAAAVVVLLLASQFIFRAQTRQNWDETIAEQQQIVFLSDSSKVILAENSSLKYPNSFKGNKRNVILTGTAYFEIVKNEEKPFHIDAPNTKIKVLGTKFLVDATKSDIEKVLVDEGKVAFSSRSVLSRQKVILTKNEIGIWDVEKHQLSEQINPEENSNTWLSGRLSFSRLPLANVLETIEKHYHLKIELADKSFETLKYSGQFNNQSAEDVIKTVCLTLNCTYEKHNNIFIIKP